MTFLPDIRFSWATKWFTKLSHFLRPSYQSGRISNVNWQSTWKKSTQKWDKVQKIDPKVNYSDPKLHDPWTYHDWCGGSGWRGGTWLGDLDFHRKEAKPWRGCLSHVPHLCSFGLRSLRNCKKPVYDNKKSPVMYPPLGTPLAVYLGFANEFWKSQKNLSVICPPFGSLLVTFLSPFLVVFEFP